MRMSLCQHWIDLQVFRGLLPGARVQHPTCGSGYDRICVCLCTGLKKVPARRCVEFVDVDDQRCKPYMVAFESGEIHSYSRVFRDGDGARDEAGAAGPSDRGTIRTSRPLQNGARGGQQTLGLSPSP